MTKALIKQIRTGKVKQMGQEGAKNPMDRPWKSGIFKQERTGNVWLTKTGLVTDEIADTKAHGGPEKALFAYPEIHYAFWQEKLDAEIGAGAFGENLVITGLDETQVCIGDSYQLGEAVIQVSQPRRPCWKPARRFRTMDLALKIQNSGRTGWYFRVLKTGNIVANTALILVERPFPEWSITTSNDVMYKKKHDLNLTKQLADCDLLATNWKRTLYKRLEGKESVLEKRVFGPNKEE
jgi:MOSC domain-containing protein YiiM